MTWRKAASLVAVVVGFAASVVQLVDAPGRWGWWHLAWRNRWTVVLGVLLLVVAASAVSWARHAGSRPSLRLIAAGALSILAAWVDGRGDTRWQGCLLVGATVTVVGVAIWFGRWVARRHRDFAETPIVAMQHGLEECGRFGFGRLYRGLCVIANGPLPSVTHPMRGPVAVAAGVVVVCLTCAASTSALGVIAYAVSAIPGRHDASEGPPTAPEETTTTRATVASTLSREFADGSTTTSSVPGTLVCRPPKAEGQGLSPEALRTLAELIAQVANVFLLCEMGPMVWRDQAAVYEQRIFTYDGDGAALVIWRSVDRWVATFISSDDAAAYRSLTSDLDWRVLGRPLPFLRCAGLWIQPFVGDDQRITGIGVRDREDVQWTAEQPLFVWGAAVESLLRRPAAALRLPAGMPAVDADGPIQYYANGETVRAAAAGAEQLTLAGLMRHCSNG